MAQDKFGKIWASTAVLSFLIEGGFGQLRRGLIAHNAIVPWHAPDLHSYLKWIVVAIVGGFAFSHFFLQGYKGQGWMEGVRFGIWITLLVSVTEVLGFWGELSMGRRLPVAFIVSDLVTFMVCGVVAALIAGQARVEGKASSAAA